MISLRAAFSSFLLSGALLMASGVTTPALAHDAPRVETEVKLSATGDLDVTHVLQLSAAQRLLHKAGVIGSNDISGLRARAKAAIYASQRFDLIADDTTVALEILGAEIRGGHLYIYQTGHLTSLPETWSARNAILRDLSPRFDNIINVPTEDGIQSIAFGGSDMDVINTTN